MLQETHSNVGRAEALKLPPDMPAFWSDGTSHQAGVGIIVKHAFLAHFNPVVPQDWVEVVPGRVALLHLRGPAGALDLVAVHLPTGPHASSERIAVLQHLGSHVQDRQKVLTVIAGDFNYVVAERDRINKDTGALKGDGDLRDEQAFQEHLATPHGLRDMFQAHFTCDSSRARSRLDRVYTNVHLVDQLDRHCSSAALQWCKNPSWHRPLAFSRRRSARRLGCASPLPTAPLEDPDWLPRVRREYFALLATDDKASQPLGRLLLLKEAIWQVTMTMSTMTNAVAAVTTEDKLGWAMLFLRAADDMNLSKMATCAKAYPRLAALVDVGNPILRASSEMRILREHIIELARQDITDDLTALQADTTNEDQQYKARRKENILVKLRRLQPGTYSGRNAMADEGGKVTADPAEMTGVLRKHWSKVFSKKAIDQSLLSRWLEDSFMRDERGRVASGLRDASSASWQVRRRGAQRAVKLSGNGAAGPDGILYKAWRKAGDLGVEILFEAMGGPVKPDAAARLRAAYGAEVHDFNLSLLSCLPKKRSGVDEDVGDNYLASATRPLTIGNTDNRLLANAARLRPSGALVFFDFKAAFPSEDHDYLLAVLEHIGVPGHSLNLIRALYDGTRCRLICKGGDFEGFDIHAGIRQGFPLSPVLFAVAVDVLLRRLMKELPDATFRAFAGDIGAAVQDSPKSADVLECIFFEFASTSGLGLNLPKTMVIPLWEATSGAQAEESISGLSDWWGRVAVQDNVEHYLRCPSVRAVAARELRFRECDWEHLLLAGSGIDDDSLTYLALLVYAAYNTFNLFHCRDSPPIAEIAQQALVQNCLNGAQGHAASARVLDGRWAQRPSQRRRLTN
ncbi:unnamed protein product [Prorocentrum cordatum]|uniref:Reverse transcriptase domain-containing protein n=1 Tax=Prorocentrum cordatum TaxID=2364126 RepID=A0ABN9VFM7_9DINO|nr:unnamed protein product [Polarella glacialis]